MMFYLLRILSLKHFLKVYIGCLSQNLNTNYPIWRECILSKPEKRSAFCQTTLQKDSHESYGPEFQPRADAQQMFREQKYIVEGDLGLLMQLGQLSGRE